MPIDNNTALFEQKDGDTADIAVDRRVPVIRQADGTAEDVSAANPMPTSDAALALLLAHGAGVSFDSVSVVIAQDDVVLGANNSAAAAVGGIGSITAKLRAISRELGSIDTKTADLDDVSGVTRGITDAHAHIHESEAWKVHYTVTTASSDGDRTGIAFKTPDTTTKGHLVVIIGSSHPAEFFLVEAPSASDFTAGTDKVILNRDRSSVAASVMASLAASPTAGSVSTFTEAQMVTAAFTGGTELDHTTLGVGSNPREVGGTSRGMQEYILKPDTIYVMYLQNIGANANIQSLEPDWYEHIDVA